MTTLGQLVSTLYAKFERQYHDHELAVVATQVAIDEILSAKRRGARPRAS